MRQSLVHQLGMTLVLVVTATLTAGCDMVYFARIDVGPHGGRMDTADPLPIEDRDRCVTVFFATAKELGLECHESQYPIITGSYDPTVYHLTACKKPGDFTDIQLAVGPQQMSVELSKIGGFREPAFFRRCRIGFSEQLRQGCGNEHVTVRYPYQW